MRLDLLTAAAAPHVTATLSAWRTGQILDAVVTRITNVGTATLNVNNLSIDVNSELPLIAGSRLLLEVTQTGPRITLRVLTPPVPKDAIAEALRVWAPRQSDLAPVLTELTRIAQSTTLLSFAAASPALRELAKNIIERIRTPTQTTTADELKSAVKNAGPFFEHRLATAASIDDVDQVLNRDLKAGLLQLAGYLKIILPPSALASGLPAAPLPPSAAKNTRAPRHAALSINNAAPLETLAKEVDAALARITTQQLLSLPERDAGTPQWIFDLPLRNGERVDVFHLHVFREKHPRDSKQPPAWCVRLSFDLVTLGKVGVLVTLFAASVSISIWAQHPETAHLFEEHLTTLRTELQAAGVAISRLHCECGAAPFSSDAPLRQKRSGLIDERA